MTMLETLKAASLGARKGRNASKAALLSTLISDAQMVGKNDGDREPTDAEIISIIKKYITNINETKKHLIANSFDTSQLEQCVKDVTVLETFLPRQLSVAELEQYIGDAITNLESATIKDLGKVMKYLKDNYGGQYDAKVASELTKEKLNGTG